MNNLENGSRLTIYKFIWYIAAYIIKKLHTKFQDSSLMCSQDTVRKPRVLDGQMEKPIHVCIVLYTHKAVKEFTHKFILLMITMNSVVLLKMVWNIIDFHIVQPSLYWLPVNLWWSMEAEKLLHNLQGYWTTIDWYPYASMKSCSATLLQHLNEMISHRR